MRFHHIGITVPDLEEAVRFFCDVLEFNVILRTEPGGAATPDYAQAARIPAGTPTQGLAVLRNGAASIELFQYGAEGQAAAGFPTNEQVGGHHLAFEVDDMDAALARLTAAGGTQCAPPRVARAPAFRDMRWVYVVAPFGLQLELVQFPNGSF